MKEDYTQTIEAAMTKAITKVSHIKIELLILQANTEMSKIEKKQALNKLIKKRQAATHRLYSAYRTVADLSLPLEQEMRKELK